MIRANALGLTDGVDVRRPINDRLRMALNDFRAAAPDGDAQQAEYEDL
jgi:hypothetical protein